VKFCVGKQVFHRISAIGQIPAFYRTFFVFPMQFGLRWAAAFVSSPIICYDMLHIKDVLTAAKAHAAGMTGAIVAPISTISLASGLGIEEEQVVWSPYASVLFLFVCPQDNSRTWWWVSTKLGRHGRGWPSRSDQTLALIRFRMWITFLNITILCTISHFRQTWRDNLYQPVRGHIK